MSTRSLVVVMCVAVASPAAAQTGTARGEALFKQGVDLRAAGKTAEACEAFDASEKADPNLGTLMYLADCREANQELTSAWSFFLEAEKRTRNATDDESKAINNSAKDRAALLEPRLSKLRLVVPAPSRVDGLYILIGHESLASSSWNLDVPVDGKTHTITARAPGYRPWTTTVTVAIEGDHRTVDIPVLVPAPKPPPPPPSTVIIERSAVPRVALKVLPFVVVAIGAASLAGGIYFESESRRVYDLAEGEPEDVKQTYYWDRAKTQRYKAIGFTAGGLACAGVAVWLWLRDTTEPARAATTAVRPVVDAGFTGVQIGRTW